MGLFNKAATIIEKSVDIIDQAVTDVDKANELKADLAKTIAEHMLTGSGASITKTTICVLVGLIVCIGAYIFLTHPENIEGFREFALSVTPLIGFLIGGYATGTTMTKILKK